ncbi:MAG: FG-GAP-like repeat-containing protein [Polyangiaceae bacterium]
MRTLRFASLLVVAGLTGVTFRSHVARAAWPPGPSDDLTNPNNWPNDPDYKGTWQWKSYLPQQKPNTQPFLSADQKLGASGMSVDKAWVLSVGDPRTRIAVLDSGIEWENPDLVNKAYLNAAELGGTKRPQTAAGGVCGGAGDLAGYDCNGDGVFSVADYRDDPRMSPVVAGDKCLAPDTLQPTATDRIQGDINHNCILDAGDLIEQFSDGVDDDGDGYVDDISGWDFYKNDNNPYDDTRYGHGTGEARDSTAEGNNGIGGIGGCPRCRFVSLRVGDSFIADANDFAKAVIMATDTGANVVQEALGTIDMTAYTHAALDYAYSKNVAVIASMADENSRHHNFPATANHTLPVHAITYNGPDYDSSSSFLNFNTCTNFGGQLALSVSGPSCSSEATGRTSGITGLIYSYARAQSLTLTSEEIFQLYKMTSDDIDVPESRETEGDNVGLYYESKPGWDQRFGYGRVNAAKLLAQITSKMIPPEVDITSPLWFDTIYSNRGSGTAAVYGRVSAARAQSYDYKVEWAPGVEPDDSQFQPLGAPMNAIGPTTVSGNGTPLATIDANAIDTAHVADPDSPHHENDKTITVRIRATAHYAGGDVSGEARRTVAVVNGKNGLDDDLLPGFPVALGSSGDSSPKLVDIDGDGQKDIVLGTAAGDLHVFSMKSGLPTELPGFPFHTLPIDGLNPAVTDPAVPKYLGSPAYVAGKNGGVDPAVAREALEATAAIADLDGDGKPEIVEVSYSGTVYVVNAQGQSLAGWPKRLSLVPSCPQDPSKTKPAACMDVFHGFARGAFGSPVLADFDKDGKPEIVVAAFDGHIYVFHADGSLLSGFPVLLHSDKTKKYNRIWSTPAVADFNGDGIPDIASGSNEEIGGGGGTGPVFVVDGRGMNAPGGPYLKNWPITEVSLHLFPVVAEGIDSSPAVSDMDGDGQPDLLVQGNGAPPTVFKADPGVPPSEFSDAPNRLPVNVDDAGTQTVGFDSTAIFGALTKATVPDTMFPLFSQPAFGDLDQDGTPDVIMAGGSLSLAASLAGGSTARPFQHLLAAWSGKTGHMFAGMPVVLEDYTFFVNETVADVGSAAGPADGYPEMIVGTGGYFLHAVDACGDEVKGWPKLTNGWIAASAAIGDINGDHALDVVVPTRDGYLYAWKTKGTDDGVVQWESFHHDNQNTGDYRVKLDQGKLESGNAPLVCAVPEEPTNTSYDAGGCSITEKKAPLSIGGLIAAAFAALAFGARRSRKKR